ncbi:MAG: dynamin family protein [Parabacteroides sp.]|nr:dynamin family protein [Parabacteroides sp.]
MESKYKGGVKSNINFDGFDIVGVNQAMAGKTIKESKTIMKKRQNKTNQLPNKNKLALFKNFYIKRDEIYPVIIASNVSSGKSTLINAIVGDDILPSKNQICTDRMVAFLDNDELETFKVHINSETDGYKVYEKVNKQLVKDFNDNKQTAEMLLEGDIKGIRNNKKSLMLVDTPGANNFKNVKHKNLTLNILKSISNGLIVYVFNATTLATYDDKEVLLSIQKILKTKKNVRLIFVINGMDCIDSQKESPLELVYSCNTFIKGMGFENYKVIPVSAYSALLFKKAIYGLEMTENESDMLYRLFRKFKNDSFSLNKLITGDQEESLERQVCVGDDVYRYIDLVAALENTGIISLENAIDELLVSSLNLKAAKIKAK